MVKTYFAPSYPYEARRQRITGTGILLIEVDSTSGAPTAVTMARSTGHWNARSGGT
jgi:outer membrane biosynthesis protein TonB